MLLGLGRLLRSELARYNSQTRTAVCVEASIVAVRETFSWVSGLVFVRGRCPMSSCGSGELVGLFPYVPSSDCFYFILLSGSDVRCGL